MNVFSSESDLIDLITVKEGEDPIMSYYFRFHLGLAIFVIFRSAATLYCEIPTVQRILNRDNPSDDE